MKINNETYSESVSKEIINNIKEIKSISKSLSDEEKKDIREESSYEEEEEDNDSEMTCEEENTKKCDVCETTPSAIISLKCGHLYCLDCTIKVN